MKKSAFLAVSALSLGVVGLAGFAPIINADATTSTTNATITVDVQGGLGIGTGDGANSQVGTDKTLSALNVNFGSINTHAAAEKSVEVAMTNNTGNTATMTLKDADKNTNLVSGGNTIPTNASISEGSSAWGVKVDTGAYQAMPASNGTAINVLSSNGTTETNIKATVSYKVSTSSTQAKGTYTDTVKYTATGTV